MSGRRARLRRSRLPAHLGPQVHANIHEAFGSLREYVRSNCEENGIMHPRRMQAWIDLNLFEAETLRILGREAEEVAEGVWGLNPDHNIRIYNERYDPLFNAIAVYGERHGVSVGINRWRFIDDVRVRPPRMEYGTVAWANYIWSQHYGP
jgi:hypothetical protein